MRFIDDGYAREDLIGYDAAKKSVVELIGSIEVAKASGSFTIGVFGDWGTGKTSILRQIQLALNTEDIEVFTVWFNPWQYAQGTNIINAFLKATLTECLNGEDAKKTRRKKAVENASKFGQGLAKSAQMVLSKVQVTPSLEGPPSVSVTPPTLNELPDRGIFEYYNEEDLLVRIQKSALFLKDTKLVIFIDDVDRCSPDSAIDLLDGIKVLFDIPNFVIIIGASKRIIEKAVRHRYNNFYDKDSTDLSDMKVDYLDKLIQFEFALPRPDRDKVVNNIVKPFLERLDISHIYASIIIDSVPDYNPRTLKRLFNVIQFSITTGKNKLGNSLNRKLALKAALLKDRHRYVAKFLVNNANDFLKIQSNLDDDSISVAGSYIEALVGNLSEAKSTELEDLLDPKVAPVIVDILRLEMETEFFSDTSMIRNYFSLAEQSTSEIELENSTKKVFSVKSRESLAPLTGGNSKQALENNLVLFTAGSITQGDEKNGTRKVSISSDFMIGKYEVTSSEYLKVLGREYDLKTGDHPVSGISWWDAVKFCNLLSERAKLDPVYDFEGAIVNTKLDHNGYRLPTEAEWEFALSKNYSFSEEMTLEKYAWHSNNSKYEIHDVGALEPFGELYDMLGNVWEWCTDWYGIYDSKLPVGPEKGTHKVCRGGSYTNFSNILTPNYRGKEMPGTIKPNVGFRVARTVKNKG